MTGHASTSRVLTREAIMDMLWLILPPGRARWPVNLERLADEILAKLDEMECDA